MKSGKTRAMQPAEVRNIRNRYAEAIRAGYAPDEAAKLAQSGAVIVPRAKPPAAKPEQTASAPPPKPATDGPTKVRDTRIPGHGDRQPRYTLADLPPQWQELPWAELRKFAQDLSGKTVSSRKAAITAIEGSMQVSQPEAQPEADPSPAE